MSATGLVPANHTHFERALAAVLEPLDAIDPARMETLWNAWACPTAFLPFLAYALSVDIWDDAWDENLKRQAIADSPAYHRLKGTRRAVEMAVGTLGRPAQLIEWHETFPNRRRGTFEIRVPSGPGEDLVPLLAAIGRMRRLVMAAKPKSRAFGVTLTTMIDMTLAPSCGVYLIDRVELAAPPDEAKILIAPSAGVISHEIVTLGAP